MRFSPAINPKFPNTGLRLPMASFGSAQEPSIRNQRSATGGGILNCGASSSGAVILLILISYREETTNNKPQTFKLSNIQTIKHNPSPKPAAVFQTAGWDWGHAVFYKYQRASGAGNHIKPENRSKKNWIFDIDYSILDILFITPKIISNIE